MSPSSVRAARVLVFALVVVVPAAAAQPASAQSAPRGRAQTADPAQPQADALFAEGRDLLEKGRFSEACARLARSEELSPAVGTLLNLGYCYEQVGQLRSAMDAYSEADVLATAAGETKRAAFAKERFAAVEPRAPKLDVRVTAPEPPGLEIARNSVALW
jgi:Flp pilus assembly protein TadD